VVVYSDSRVHFLTHSTQCVGALLNRAAMLLHYGPRLLTRMLLRFDFNYLEQILAIASPPYLLAFLALALITFAKTQNMAAIPGTDTFWIVTTGLVLALNVLGLVVARCRANDYATMLFYTPITYLFGIVASPLAFYSY